MTGKFLKIAGLLMFLSTMVTEAQILKDTATLNLIRRDIDLIYNLQFPEARMIYDKVVEAYPGHPVAYLLNGMITYWENYPLIRTSPARASFESDMRECISLSEKSDDQEHEAEYLLANLSGRGFLLLFYSDNGMSGEVIPLASGTYKFLRRSFNYTSECTDLYYFTGVYNYYRDAYPRIYPVYKPLAMLFPSGNEKVGLEQLNIAAVNSVVLRAESLFLLVYIYTNFENDYHKSMAYAKTLYDLYPNNSEFTASYIKNLLLLKKYDEATKIINTMKEGSAGKFLQAQISVFRGIIQEKRYRNATLAVSYYNKGILDISLFGSYGNEYAAYAYFGLSRISEANGDRRAAQMYHKEAVRIADFKKVNFD